MKKLLVGSSAAFSIALVSFVPLVGAAGSERQPNITPFPARDIRIVEGSDGTTELRFSTLSWNNGAGPLEIRAGAIDTANGRQ